jgi:hypothetical protein
MVATPDKAAITIPTLILIDALIGTPDWDLEVLEA